eukprot:2559183-Amphidinium_carterae.1
MQLSICVRSLSVPGRHPYEFALAKGITIEQSFDLVACIRRSRDGFALGRSRNKERNSMDDLGEALGNSILQLHR